MSGEREPGKVVLKIGGSLVKSDAARRVMEALSARRPKHVLIVPGGGTFADAVRAAQGQSGLSERAAHHMALLGMHQYGVMLADLADGFGLAESISEIEARWREGRVPIWLPAPMVLAAPQVAASWSVTSDSLAAWVAARVGAVRLVLVKSCVLPEARDAHSLAAAGIVDGSFPDYVKDGAFSWDVVTGPDQALAAI